jgi:hypothetical protein
VKLAVDLTAAQADMLKGEASRLGVPVEDLARAAVLELISARSEEFRRAAEQVVRKNLELYDRIA